VQGRTVLNTKMNSRIPKKEVRLRVTSRQQTSPNALSETKLTHIKFDKILP
jgi:hypothetical protein